MEQLPLIPKAIQNAHFNAASVLRETFRDVLKAPLFPENIVGNVSRYTCTKTPIKKFGDDVKKKMDSAAAHEGLLLEAELKVMKDNAKAISRKDTVCKVDEMYSSTHLDADTAKEHFLIRTEDLRPSSTLRALDSKLRQMKYQTFLAEQVPSKSQTQPVVLQPLTHKYSRSARRKFTKLGKAYGKYASNVLRAEPDVVLFFNYKINEPQYRRFKIRNISSTAQSFQLVRRHPNPKFKVHLEANSRRLAPGMAATFSVEFRTDTKSEVTEDVVVYSQDGGEVIVRISTYKDSPALIVKFEKSVGNNMKILPSYDSIHKFDNPALNYTFDFGMCLLGRADKWSLQVRNEGGLGRFLILTEDGWYSNTIQVQDINGDLEMNCDPFYLFPVYFELDSFQMIEIQAMFYPTEVGLHTKKFFFIADNNTINEIDFLGEGIVFDHHSVIIALPRGITGQYDDDANYVIDFGTVFPTDEVQKTFTVHNNSPLDLDFAVRLREAKQSLQNKKVHQIKENWLVVNPERGTIPARGDFDISITMSIYEATWKTFFHVLEFFVVDVPEESLEPDFEFKVDYKHCSHEDSNSQNILLSTIVLKAVCKPCFVLFSPPAIVVTQPIIKYKSEAHTVSMSVYNPGYRSLECTWLYENDQKDAQYPIKIHPKKFKINANNYVECVISIVANSYEDIDEICILDMDDGKFEQELVVKAMVEKPYVDVSNDFVKFSCNQSGSVDSKTIKLINKFYTALQWKIKEKFYDFKEDKIVEMDNSYASTAQGELQAYGKQQEIECQIPKEFEYGDWLSFLEITTKFLNEESLSAIVMLSASLPAPDVEVIVPNMRSPIIYSEETLFVGMEKTYQVKLVNSSTTGTSYKWSEPFGADIDALRLEITPSSGFIYGSSEVAVSFKVTPLKMHCVQDFHVHCRVEKMKKPQLVSLLCNVEDVSVIIIMPSIERDSDVVKIHWPEQMTTITLSLKPALLPKIEIENEVVFPEDMSVASLTGVASPSLRSQKSPWFGVPTISERSSVSRDPSVASTLILMDASSVELIMVKDAILEAEVEVEGISDGGSVHLINPPHTLSSTTSLVNTHVPLYQKYSHLENWFDVKHMVEFKNCTPFKTYSKTILIKNCAGKDLNFEAAVSEFKSKGSNENCHIREALMRLNYLKESSIYEDRIQSGKGVVIMVNPFSGSLKRGDEATVTLTVYSNTFGLYNDTLTVQVDDLPPFIVKVYVEVIGNPLEFTMFRYTDPIIRFNTFIQNDLQLQKQLKVKNFSSIPIRVFWILYLVDDLGTHYDGSFDVVLHIDDNEEDPDTIISVPEIYGIPEKNLLKVEPSFSLIHPGTHETVTVKADIKYNNVLSTRTVIDAILVGFTYPMKNMKRPDEFTYRCAPMSGPRLHVKIVLKMNKAEPLALMRQTNRIEVYINEVIQNSQFNCVGYTIVELKNCNAGTVAVLAHSSLPFEVVSISTSVGFAPGDNTAIAVPPGEYVEIKVECKMDYHLLKLISELFYTNRLSEMQGANLEGENMVTLGRPLRIHYGDTETQSYSLDVGIIFPNITLGPKKLSFGSVYIGNSKEMCFYLRNESASKVWFTVDIKHIKYFTAYPSSGYLKPASPTAAYSEVITVKFTPKEAENSRDHIRVKTKIPLFCENIVVTGNGIRNEKFYKPGF